MQTTKKITEIYLSLFKLIRDKQNLLIRAYGSINPRHARALTMIGISLVRLP